MRPKNTTNSDCEDYDDLSDKDLDNEEEQPKRKGRPIGSGRKEKDFEEML